MPIQRQVLELLHIAVSMHDTEVAYVNAIFRGLLWMAAEHIVCRNGLIPSALIYLGYFPFRSTAMFIIVNEYESISFTGVPYGQF